MKKVQIGARINAEDAEFLNLLKINGATTPSDKLRAIIEEARLRREYARDYTGSFRMIQEQIQPLVERIKKNEFDMGIHSALLTRIFEWMPDFYAYCLCSLPEDLESKEQLTTYEKGAVERVARLVESLLHQELSTKETSYTPDVLIDHISDLSAIINLIELSSQKKEG